MLNLTTPNYLSCFEPLRRVRKFDDIDRKLSYDFLWIGDLPFATGQCEGLDDLLVCIAGPVSAQTTEWVYHKTADGLHPDGNEQQMVWLMNRARANPTAEGLFLAASGDTVINYGISFFRVDTALMKAEFAAIAAKPPAAFDRRIYEGSSVHSLDLIARNALDHTNQAARVTAAGFSYASTARLNSTLLSFKRK